jgi:hypothetical protein
MSEKEEVFKVDGWNHILVEGYCCVNTDYFSKSSKYVYGWSGNKDPAARGERPNPDYDPNAKPNEKPSWCKGHVCKACLESDVPVKMCPHLAYGSVGKIVKKKFRKMIHKIYDKEVND